MFTAPVLGGLFFFLICSYLFHRAIESKKHQAQSHLWPSVKGIILESSVTTRAGNSNGFIYSVLYSYEVDDIKYKHNIPAFYDIRLKDECYAFAEKYKKGDVVDIYYLPSNPQKAVLEIEMNGRTLKGTVGVLGFLTFASFCFMVAAALGYIS
jgi:hypothetical protein